MALSFVSFTMAVAFALMSLVTLTVAVALSFMSVAVAASALMALAMAALVVAVLVMTSAAAVASAFLRSELSVKSLGKFLLCGVTDRNDLALEIQCLAGHRMVEVHGDRIIIDSGNESLYDHS